MAWLFVAAILLTCASILNYGFQKEHQAAHSNVEKQARLLNKLFASQVAAPIHFRDYFLLWKTIKTLTENSLHSNQPEFADFSLREAAVLDTNKKVLSHTNMKRYRLGTAYKPLPEDIDRLFTTGRNGETVIFRQEEHLLVTASPVVYENKMIGLVVTTVDFSVAEQLERQLIVKYGTAALLMLGILLVLYRWGRDKRVAAEAIASAKDNLQLILDSAHEGIYGVDMNGDCTFANLTCTQMFGYSSPHDLMGRNIHQLAHHTRLSGEPYPEDDCPIYHTYQTGEPTHIDGDLFWRQDSSSFPVEYRSYPIRDNDVIIGAVVTFTDITNRKQAEKKLRQAAAVFENATDGVIITDAQGTIVSVNQAITQITGYREDEVLGKNPNIFKSDRHDPSFFQDMWASLNQHDHWRGEIWNRRKYGEIFPCWQTISAVRDDQTGEIQHYVSLMSDITAIKDSQERLEHLAHHDPLTNLPNRLLFNDRLEHAIERAHRENGGIGVMFIDLDNFKPINDGLGHAVGDRVLQLVAERMTSQVREDDTVARISGDEFALIMEDTKESQDVAHVAAKILSAFEAPLQVDTHELHVTTSIGISLYPEDGKDVTTLVKNADAAMYRAKKRGKNRYCYYTMDLTDAAMERLELQNDLRVALKQNEFRIYYQPQYSLATGQLIGAEALVRWQHPKLGLISPVKFIPLAESTGLIVPIGRWVLHEACAKTKSWQDAGLDISRIGVNVAGRQIQSGDMVQTVQDVLEQTGLEPQCLELEVTESFIVRQTDKAISMLEELRDLGVTLAIDDFGTGYSALSYLKRLPVNKLKIDRSFVNGIPHDPDDEAITRAIIALGKSLQLQIIAEGVETEEQKEFIALEGCNEVQGYYYSPPVPEKDFVELLKSIE